MHNTIIVSKVIGNRWNQALRHLILVYSSLPVYTLPTQMRKRSYKSTSVRHIHDKSLPGEDRLKMSHFQRLSILAYPRTMMEPFQHYFSSINTIMTYSLFILFKYHTHYLRPGGLAEMTVFHVQFKLEET